MNKIIVMTIAVILGIAFWAYKGFQMTQAYDLAATELSNRAEIESTLGPYNISYDWWFGVFRALRYGKVQEFEFHFNGQFDDAVGVVNLRKYAEWEITCVNVVNGEYLNNRLINDC